MTDKMLQEAQNICDEYAYDSPIDMAVEIAQLRAEVAQLRAEIDGFNGRKLAPIKPTQGMIDAAIINDEIGERAPVEQGHDCSDLVDEEECAMAVYHAMIAAAPFYLKE